LGPEKKTPESFATLCRVVCVTWFKVMTLPQSWQILFPLKSRTRELNHTDPHSKQKPVVAGFLGPTRFSNIYTNCLLRASFRINKSRPLCIYTGNVQISPQGLGEVEFPNVPYCQHCCGHRHHSLPPASLRFLFCYVFRPYRFFPRLFHQLTTWSWKKITWRFRCSKNTWAKYK